LEIRKTAWEDEGKSLSKYETNNLLLEWKENKPELKEVFSQVLQNVHERIANKRYEFAHQISNQLVNRYGLIAFEDLNTADSGHANFNK